MLENGCARGACPERSRGIRERDVAQADLACRRRVGASTAGAQRAGRPHRRLEAQHRGHRRGGAVERPAESTERDHRHADGALHVDDCFSKTDATLAGGARQQPEHDDVDGDDEQHAPDDGPLAQTRGGVLELVQARASDRKAIDRPAAEAEQTQLLARGRIHRQPVRVVRVALCAAHFFGIAVAPDRALAQQPVRRQPRAGQQERRPPRIADENRRGRDAADHLDHAVRDEVHRDRQRRAGHAEIEVARDRQVARQRRILEVSDSGRAHACLGEAVVQPRGGAVAKVRADRLMNRTQDLKEDEDGAGKRERGRERMAALHGADEHAHRDRERRGQDAAQQENRPPCRGQRRIGLRQDGEELPLLTVGQTTQHERILPHNESSIWRGEGARG